MRASPGSSTPFATSTSSTSCRSTAPASRPSARSCNGCRALHRQLGRHHVRVRRARLEFVSAFRPAGAPAPRRPAARTTTTQEVSTMSEAKQLFSASLAQDAVYKTGLRSFMEYRDLGIEKATHGKFRAHTIRIKKEAAGNHELHTTGLHQHNCDFQMFYVLNGWIKFIYEGHGEHTFGKGDCILQPPGIVHNELDCSDDLEVLEIYSPAVHETVVVARTPEAVAAAR